MWTKLWSGFHRHGVTEIEARRALEILSVEESVFATDVPDRLLAIIRSGRRPTALDTATARIEPDASRHEEDHWRTLSGEVQLSWINWMRSFRPALAVAATRDPRHEMWLVGGAMCAAYDHARGKLTDESTGDLVGEWAKEALRRGPQPPASPDQPAEANPNREEVAQ